MRRKFKILFLLVLSTSYCWAQDSTAVLKYLENAKIASDYESIETQFKKAYSLAKKLNFTDGIQLSLALMGAVELEKGHTSKALRYLLEELDVLGQMDTPERLATVNATIGDIYANENIFIETLPYYRAALKATPTKALFKKLGDAHKELLQPDTAFNYYSRQLVFWDKKNINGRLNIFQDIVDAYQKADRHATALKYNERILSIMQNADKPLSEQAILYNNIGYNYNFIKNYKAAIDFFEKGYDFTPKTDYQNLSLLQMNIGIAYFNLGNINESIRAFILADELLRKINAAEKSQINHLLANVYLKNKDLYNASNYNQLAIENALKHEQPKLLTNAYYTAAQIHADLFEYQIALDYFQKHFELNNSLEQLAAKKRAAFLSEKQSLENAETEIRSLLINQEIQDLMIQQLELEGEKQMLAFNNLKLNATQQEQELVLLKQEQAVKESNLSNQQLLAKQAQQRLQLAQQQLVAFEQQQQLAELERKEQIQQLELNNKESLLKEEEQKNTLLEKDNRIQELDIERQQDFQQFLYGLGGLLLVLIGLVGVGLIYSRRTNRVLANQKVAIQQEQQKSEDLLLNILPAATAKELKEKGYSAPRKYEDTTVLFADFVNFTGISANMPPEKVVKELNACFKAFDAIMDKYGLEKIKTIGDAYLCVGGLPMPNKTHAKDSAHAALEMMDFIQQRYETKMAGGETYWQMRIGLHSGPVVAGVVGTKKFVYDVWGDAVNTASRMESNSIAGKINISKSTYQLVKEQFQTTYRGEIQAKNKGAVKMYFLEGI